MQQWLMKSHRIEALELQIPVKGETGAEDVSQVAK